MRLINTSTLQMRDFDLESVPQFAILSHTWQDGEEVSFQQFESYSKTDSAGYRKISDCCNLASSHNLEWAWIDTCCIDKTSSSEVSEAINSMFRWYQEATVCYVFLQDLEVPQTNPGENPWVSEGNLKNCRWFKRGWTLQELLASNNVLFFDRGLRQIGTKASLEHLLAKITKIDLRYLETPMAFREASVAQRMSWASERQTTREEDSAYCLMGLFGINMPLIYGEGRKAFTRLQLEIMSWTNDDTLFAWLSDLDVPTPPHGLLARSVADFRGCEDVVRTTTVDQRMPSVIGNREIHMPYSAPSWGDLFARKNFGPVEGRLTLPLRCVSASSPARERVLIHLVMARGEHGNKTGPLYQRRGSSFQPYTGGIGDTALATCSMSLFPQAPCRIAQDAADDASSVVGLGSGARRGDGVTTARLYSYVVVMIISSVLVICSLVFTKKAPFVWACATLGWTFAGQSRFLLLVYFVLSTAFFKFM